MVSDLCKNNPNIWATISISGTILIDLCGKAGLKIIEDPVIIADILIKNYPEYTNRLVFDTKRGHTVFSKKDSDDYFQILATS